MQGSGLTRLGLLAQHSNLPRAQLTKLGLQPDVMGLLDAEPELFAAAALSQLAQLVLQAAVHTAPT